MIFSDAINLDMHLAKRVFWQCALLAGPGVLLGAFLNAMVAKFIFPYEWDWNLSMAFGSILSATDPVAVVALLAHPRWVRTTTLEVAFLSQEQCLWIPRDVLHVLC